MSFDPKSRDGSLYRIGVLAESLERSNLLQKQNVLNSIDNEIELIDDRDSDLKDALKKLWWDAEQIVSISIFREKRKLKNEDEKEFVDIVNNITNLCERTIK